MSLAIDVDKVIAVLIGNQWYPVDNYSFDLDAYEYMWSKETDGRGNPLMLLGGGQESEAGVPATGFYFMSEGEEICGPITAIQAVRIEKEQPELNRKQMPDTDEVI